MTIARTLQKQTNITIYRPLASWWHTRNQRHYGSQTKASHWYNEHAHINTCILTAAPMRCFCLTPQMALVGLQRPCKQGSVPLGLALFQNWNEHKCRITSHLRCYTVSVLCNIQISCCSHIAGCFAIPPCSGKCQSGRVFSNSSFQRQLSSNTEAMNNM